LLVDDFTDTINDLVELAGDAGVLGDAAGERVGGGVEEPPGCAIFLELVECGIVPLTCNVSNALDADHTLPVHIQDDVIGAFVGERVLLVALKGPCLRFPLYLERFDYLGNQARQVSLAVRGMLPAYDVIASKRQIGTHEDF
jgi:hypothetical protein